MKYVSTRGRKKCSFEEALFSCYGENGGLLMPEKIPAVTIEELNDWKSFNYVDIVKRIVSMFVSTDEISIKDQSAILDAAFKKFDSKNVVEIVRLKDGLNIMELWHGDTLAFKDLAMTCTVQFMKYFLTKRKKHFTSIVVTSGDTGSSAMYAARNIPNIDLIVLYPHNRISSLQEIMMTTLEGDNLHLFAVDGNSDELDLAALNVLTDTEFVEKYNVGTMNSYNWCRIMVQIAHHVYGYLQTTDEIGKSVEIIVPCGGCGNITALMIGRSMGVPIYPVGVCNKNDSFYQMVVSNRRELKEVQVSVAPAMDISVKPNSQRVSVAEQFTVNVERIVWLLSNKNEEMVNRLNEDFVKTKMSELPEDVYQQMRDAIQSSVASDDVIVDAIKRCWKENDYSICPHTAAGVAHFYGLTDGCTKRRASIPTLCIATASAAKFAEVLEKSGLPDCKSEKIEKLRNLKSRAKYVARNDDWEKIMHDQVIAVSSS